MTESVIEFLNILKETIFENMDEDASEDFINGVNETIEYAEVWFESNNVTEFEVNPDED